MTERERGFALLETIVCVALFALAAAATAGALSAVLRMHMHGVARDAALMVAENALARARAAAAYLPAAAAGTADPALAGLLSGGASSFTAGAELRAPAPCGRAGTTMLVRLPVSTVYTAASAWAPAIFAATVAYPRDVCVVAADGTIPSGDMLTVTLREALPPPAFAPGHVLLHPVAPPVRM